MKNLSLIVICFIFLLQSCKKENYTELIKTHETDTKATYKKGRLFSSEVYNKNGQLDSKYLYDNGTVIKIYKYFPNQKVRSYSYLHKAPNHYTTTIYYENGKIHEEGEGDYFQGKSLYLRRGPWIFYSKSGEPYSIYTFIHDKKNEYIKGEILFDTIKKKTIRNVIFNPPVLHKQEATQTVKIFNPK